MRTLCDFSRMATKRSHVQSHFDAVGKTSSSISASCMLCYKDAPFTADFLIKVRVYLVIMYFTLLYFADTMIFTEWRSVATWPRQVYWYHFPKAFPYFMSVCHILIILTTLQMFPLLIDLLWWTISDLWFDYLHVLGSHKLHTCNTMSLTDKYTCSDCSTHRAFPYPSAWASLYPDTHNIAIRPMNNPTRASKCSSEGKSRISLTLNQKLEMIKGRKEGRSVRRSVKN